MRRTRILVVEDDTGIRQMYRATLALAGFEVDVAEDGLAALRVVDEQRPDLIVLNLHLPRLDGTGVLGELRASSRTWSIPVIVVTGAAYRGIVAEASAVIQKPCDPEDLLAEVTRLVSADRRDMSA